MTGILLVDKPEGFTSHDVIAKLRGILKERRLGHAGTLDPMATGLLVVFAGRATRAVQFAEAQRKRYVASMRPGIVTDTQDITGNVLSESDARPSADELCKLLPDFIGEISQIPPMYSAIKKDGKKLYELARRGIDVDRESRKISIYDIKYLGMDGGDFSLEIECSKGTYIRTLCHDIGARLGCGAALSKLRRTASGEFLVDNALSFEQIQNAAEKGSAAELFLPVDMLFSEHPKLILNGEQKKKCLCGNAFPTQAEDDTYRVYDSDGEFLMLGEAQDGTMITVKSFFEV